MSTKNNNQAQATNNSKLLSALKAANNKATAQELGIGQKVAKFVNEEFNGIILASLIVILIILVIYLYNRTFKKINEAKQIEIKYYKNLDLEPLPKCDKLDERLQYRLCDYYIASSHNTPAIGNQAMDYVSVDMVSRVLLNGARYIQIPIAGADVNYDTEPVVATAEGNLITSLNTLPLREVLVAIRDSAFKYIDPGTTYPNKPKIRKINYPLIIHLHIHSNNDSVLDKTADAIQDIIGTKILDPRLYHNKPITFEKLCNLLNKIIIISTPGYEASKLNQYVTPLPGQFWQTMNIDKIEPDLSNPDDQVNYFRALGHTQQKEIYAAIGKLGQIIKSGEKVPAKEMIDAVLGENAPTSQRLLLFNMIGMTLVLPKLSTETSAGTQIDSPNYNPADAIMNGCQLIAMNYQTVDETMLGYINIFRQSSFVLKPAGLRLPASEQTIADTLGEFVIDDSHQGKADPQFLLKYGSGLDYISLVNNSSEDTQASRTISFNGERLKISPLSPNMSASDLINNTGFIIRQSPLSREGNLIMLAAAHNPNLVITVSPDFDKVSGSEGIIIPDVYLAPISSSSSVAKWQTFQPEYPPSFTNITNNTRGQNIANNPEYYISFRLYPDGMRNAFYLSSSRTTIKLAPKTDDNQDQITFGIVKLPIVQHIKIASSTGYGTLRIFTGGIVSLSQSATIDKGTTLILEPVSERNNQTITGNKSRAVYLKQLSNRKYLVSTSNEIKAVLSNPDSRRSVFIITQDGDFSTITDYNGAYLYADGDGTLSFKKDKPLLQSALKNSRGRVIRPARYGNELGGGKYFTIQSKFEKA